jgi:hypothetical protein
MEDILFDLILQSSVFLGSTIYYWNFVFKLLKFENISQWSKMARVENNNLKGTMEHTISFVSTISQIIFNLFRKAFGNLC